MLSQQLFQHNWRLDHRVRKAIKEIQAQLGNRCNWSQRSIQEQQVLLVHRAQPVPRGNRSSWSHRGIQGPAGTTTVNSSSILYIDATINPTPITNVTITAPANGVVIVTLDIGYVQMYYNNSAGLYLGTSPTSPNWNNLDICYQGTNSSGPTNQYAFFDMSAQATYNMMSGSKTTFYATAIRYLGPDNAPMYLGSIRLIATFLAT